MKKKAFEDSVEEVTGQLEKELRGPKVKKILRDLATLLISKQHDYGSRNILDCGELGIVVRLSDKIARLRNLYGLSDNSLKKKSAVNESTDDSFRDLANYAIIALMLRTGQFDLPLKNNKHKR